MGLISKNMNYIFNVEYFKDIQFMKKEDEASTKLLNGRNCEIVNFPFRDEAPLAECRTMEGYQEFGLFTLYPGLLVGTGNPHGIAVAGALKQGFSFDYVTGLPYIPGSSLKGMLRSYFPGKSKDGELNKEYEALIRGVLRKDDLDVYALKENMFENNDVFLGAFPQPESKGEPLLEMEYITSHKDKFKNPNPVSLIKVRPAVKFVFSFVFSDYVIDGKTIVSAQEKKSLCKELILLMGIGAKTNTGFGKFSETKPVQNIAVARPTQGAVTNVATDKKPTTPATDAPKCKNPGCKNKVKFNSKYNKYFSYCWECSQKR